ncbi:hypothetical protein Pmar_PMAR019895 [Perkinsus marinus ATCC 50983]|uniref:Uncharacterized protein n=1 Tax=Perkinsus marinus (strain ATCC 50983 / TXsc) TaxID=423536 RepID=C5KBY1_PERM5|nr:hypothetical protein Pmar_PMAR019895 [Perkinsus marinus ATCC 50983]EER18012.1 hypothetical protein Pmar_PMAR019895 [Perkinsus marinus ATCC 50983]|eukprot:XP_002786216.1 hypothetical protein Pmar_PMAR019895 [Perkinsus marinus ATCC 50983]
MDGEWPCKGVLTGQRKRHCTAKLRSAAAVAPEHTKARKGKSKVCGGGLVADRDLGSARQYGRSGERPANAGREPLPIEQQKPLRHGSADGSPAMKLRGYRFRSLEDTRGLEPEGSNTMAHGDHGDEDPMEKAMQLQRRYLHSKILFAGPNPLPALCRIIATAIFLFMVVFVSAAIYTHSTQWMSDLLCMRTIKGDAITSNPVFGAWSERLPTNAIDGKRCRLWVQLDPDSPVPSGTVADFGAYFARTGLECGLFTANAFGGNCAGGRCITCIADRPCYSTVLPEQIDSQDVAWTDNRFPIFPSVGRPANVTLFMDSQTVIQLTDTAVGLEPICSLDGAVKPGHSIVIIGLYIGSIILLLLVIVREIREWFKIRKEVHEDTVDDALMVSHIGEAVEAMKRETESSARHNVDPHDDAAGRHKDAAARRSRVLADRR